PDVGQPGGPRVDGRTRRASAAVDGGECSGGGGDRTPGRRSGVRFPCSADLQPPAGASASAGPECGADAPRRSPPPPRNRGRDPTGPIGGRSRGGRLGAVADARGGRPMIGSHPEWLECLRGTAPLVVSLPHTGTEIPAAVAARLVSPWLSRKDTGWHAQR